MKKFLFLTSAFLIFVTSFAQVIISGQVSNPPPAGEIKLHYSNNDLYWNDIKEKKIRLNKQGKFSVKLPITKPSFAQISTGDDYTQLYLVANDSLYVTFDHQHFDSSITYTGRGAADNNFMAANLIAHNGLISERYIIFSDVDTYLKFEDSLLNSTFTPLKDANKGAFTPEFLKYVTAQPYFEFMFSRWMHLTKYDEVNKTYNPQQIPEHTFDFIHSFYPKGIRSIDKQKYRAGLYSYVTQRNDVKTENQIPDSLSATAEMKLTLRRNFDHRKNLFKDTLLDYQLTQFMRRNIDLIKDDTLFVNELMSDYRSICKRKDFLALVEKVYTQSFRLALGRPAPDFTLLNAQGQQVSLSSFKGKVVYIDFWATWCGPCIKAMSKSHDLTKKFKDNSNIVFLYVNVSDYPDKWNQYLTDKKTEGIHLYADKKQTNDLMDTYFFKAIPHYVLVGKDGNLLNIDAVGPDGIEKEILAALK